MLPSLFDELRSSVWNKLHGFMVVLIQPHPYSATLGPTTHRYRNERQSQMANENILGSLLDPKAIMGMLAVTQYIGQNILRKLRERDFGAIIDQKTGERRKMTPLEEEYAMRMLGGRKGNTLRNHIRALLYGGTAVGAVVTPAAMLGYKVITGLGTYPPVPAEPRVRFVPLPANVHHAASAQACYTQTPSRRAAQWAQRVRQARACTGRVRGGRVRGGRVWARARGACSRLDTSIW